MKSGKLLESWQDEIRRIYKNINFRIDINFEDTTDEEFYFYINPCEKISPYAFYDNCGYGIGFHFKERKISFAHYFNELGITNNEKELVQKILIDIIGGEKLFVELEKKDYSIDFSKYTGKENLEGFSDYERLSIYEINHKE